MTLRFMRWLLGLLIAVVAFATFAWFVLLRPIPQPPTNESAAIFNHGSIGNETAQGLPYWIWRVLPKIFADRLPGDGGGYAAFGMVWEPGGPARRVLRDDARGDRPGRAELPHSAIRGATDCRRRTRRIWSAPGRGRGSIRRPISASSQAQAKTPASPPTGSWTRSR